jgi:lipid A 3-O-deacylase
MIRKIGAMAGAGALFFLAAAAAHAVDGLSVEVGRGDDRTSLLRLSLTDNWRKRDPAVRDWHLAGYWEVSAAIWDNRDESVADLAATPVFRIERRSIYLEGAIGFHLVTSHISAHRTFSTAFQFGDHVGAGFRFGPGGRYDFGMRVQHISNGDLRKPNPGINFVLMHLQYELD